MTQTIALPRPDWNRTARDYVLQPLHEAFEQQVARTPDAVALRFRDRALTYAELNAWADALAATLAGFGAGPGTLTAVCMERSLEMVVALYAILKAGSAYVPIDPEYPAERISFMANDAAAPILLTHAALGERFAGTSARVLVIDADAGPVDSRPAGSSATKATLDDLAYVIYTSGSTGQPKGAMNTHRAISNRIQWMQEAFQLRPADRILQKTPFSFDVSVWEFFWPLLYGAELVIAEPGGHRDSSYLAQEIMERGITTIHFVPSMLQLFLEDPRAGDCASLKRVICSGEALPKAVQDRFFDRLDAELHNLYGPTEAAVDVTWWACDPRSDLAFVPIGKPIANTQMHVLDPELRPVPIGTAGELYIGGVQVGRGYLNRPELTAERFIADPFATEPGARLYKTGDLARYLPDGNIEFLGRSDFQVKIRGFRVELGEIEAALEAIDGVRQAIVVARERSGGDLELVAYVSTAGISTAGQHGPTTDDLKARLLTRLPAYMVPTTFVSIERFPLSPNGKVDRKALPAPTRARPELGTPYAEPRSAVERLVADKWRHILDVEAVGIHDRFFELGGTSLQAARFVNEMQTELRESIFVVTLFAAPSVAEYAAFLRDQYPVAVARLVGQEPGEVGLPAIATPITEVDVARLRAAVPLAADEIHPSGDRNPRAIFILSPPRSGTTLLRIMLAGHRDLFAASELQLLGFRTLDERAAAYVGRFSPWLDGAIRTVMAGEGPGGRRGQGIHPARNGRGSHHEAVLPPAPGSGGAAHPGGQVAVLRARPGGAPPGRGRLRRTAVHPPGPESRTDDQFLRAPPHAADPVPPRSPVRLSPARGARLDAEPPDDPDLPGRHSGGALDPPQVRGPGDRSGGPDGGAVPAPGPGLRSGRHPALRAARRQDGRRGLPGVGADGRSGLPRPWSDRPGGRGHRQPIRRGRGPRSADEGSRRQPRLRPVARRDGRTAQPPGRSGAPARPPPRRTGGRS